MVSTGVQSLDTLLGNDGYPERTSKKHVRLLGFSALGVTAVIIDEVFYRSSGFNLPLGVIFIVLSYVLYSAVMSLSPIGKLEPGVQTRE